MSRVVAAFVERSPYYGAGFGFNATESIPQIKVTAVRDDGSSFVALAWSKLYELCGYDQFDHDADYVYYATMVLSRPFLKGDFIFLYFHLPDLRIEFFRDHASTGMQRARSRMRLIKIHHPTGVVKVETIDHAAYTYWLGNYNRTLLVDEDNSIYPENYNPKVIPFIGSDQKFYCWLSSGRQSVDVWNVDDGVFQNETFFGLSQLYVNDLSGGNGNYINMPSPFYDSQSSPSQKIKRTNYYDWTLDLNLAFSGGGG